MSQTSSMEELLQACLSDLYAGCNASAGRLPGIAEHAADSQVRHQLLLLANSARERAGRLTVADVSLSGPENLWMAGILDDAERDTHSTERGTLLDLALIGAVRKALAAEIVSIDTAVAVAGAKSNRETQRALKVNQSDLLQIDTVLQRRLVELAA